jgi:hypothetical protein
VGYNRLRGEKSGMLIGACVVRRVDRTSRRRAKKGEGVRRWCGRRAIVARVLVRRDCHGEAERCS